MSTLINDKDLALQAAPYRDKGTLVTVTSTNPNFTLAKNGGPVTPANTVLTAVPNIVFTSAAVYTWHYALNTAPTTWKGFEGGLIASTTFAKTGSSKTGVWSYSGLSPIRTSGSGTGAVFTVVKSVSSTNYNNATITVTSQGTGYQVGDQIVIAGTDLGAANITGALIPTSTTLSKTGIAVSKTVVNTYTGITQKSTLRGAVAGPGSGATFTIQMPANTTSYSGATVTITNGGTNYAVGDKITIAGNYIGGINGTNDLTLTISGIVYNVSDYELVLTVGGSVSSLTGTSQTITNTTIKSIIGATNATSIQFRCTAAETLLETAYGYTTIAYSLEQANSDSVNIELSKVAATISLNAAGVAATYSGTGTTITVTRGGTSLAYDPAGGTGKAVSSANSFAVEIITDTTIDPTISNRVAGGSTSTATSYIFSGITSITADYATVTFKVFVYNASGNLETGTLKQIQYSRVSSGQVGQDAILYYIDASASVISKSTSSINETGQFTQITLAGKRTIAGVTTNYGYITVTGDSTDTSTEAALGTDVSVTPYTTNIPNTSKDSKLIVRLYSAADRAASSTKLLDTQTIPVIFAGSNALVTVLSNESVSIPVSAGGFLVAGSFANTGTIIKVFEGDTELTYNTGTSTTTAATWVVSVTASTGITLGTTSAVSGAKYAVQSAILAMSNTDLGSVTFAISGKTQGGKSFSFTRVQSLSKIYPGSDANIYYLDVPTPIISKTSESITTDGVHSSLTITGKQAIGNATPTNTGYITIAPNVKITAIATNGNITCTGVSYFTVNSPIIFTGIGYPAQITVGTTYYIKTIDTANRLITIAATSGGVLKTYTTAVSSLTTGFAYSEPVQGTSISITPTIPNDAGIYSLLIKLYSAADRTAVSTKLLDSQEVLVLYKGSNAVSAILSNDSVGIPCSTDINGNITAVTGAYNASSTNIRVFEGTTELTFDAVATAANTAVDSMAAGKWKVKTTGAYGITPGAISASGIYAVTASAAGISAETATIPFIIEGKTSGGTTFSITKTQTFSRNASGKPGSDGKGYKVALINAYAWTNTGSPPALVGTFNYTWANKGSLTAVSSTLTTGANVGFPTTGWVASAPASPGSGYTLYQALLTITDLDTATVSNNINWADARTNRLGYTEKGEIGWTGNSAKIAYIVTTSATPPATPTAGVGDVVPTSSAGTWSFTPTQVLEAGQFMYQSDGTYTLNVNTQTYGYVWRAPYLSNLKVGQLSAITADMGAINSGSLNIGDGKFIVDRSGSVTIKGSGVGHMEINNEVIRVYDANGSLRVKLGYLSGPDY